MAAETQFNIGSSRAIAGVQKKRNVTSIALILDKGVYSAVVTYDEWEEDGSGNLLYDVRHLTYTRADAQLGAGVKSTIDNLYNAAGSLIAALP